MIFPLSPFTFAGCPQDHMWSWYVRVREKDGAKREFTYWVGSNWKYPNQVREFIAKTFHRIEILKIGTAERPPGQDLFPVPAHHYQFGIIAEIERKKRLLLAGGVPGYNSIVRSDSIISVTRNTTYVPLAQRSSICRPQVLHR